MIVAATMQLDHPDGPIRLSTLPYDWEDPEGRVWLGAGGIVTIGARGPASGVDGGAFTVTWSGADPALIASAFDGRVIRLRFEAATVWLDGEPLARVGAPMDVWAGLCEAPAIAADPAAPGVVLTIQSPLLDLGRTRRTLFDPDTQKRLDPDDTAADWIAMLADYRAELK